jgi:hypothetical protein
LNANVPLGEPAEAQPSITSGPCSYL